MAQEMSLKTNFDCLDCGSKCEESVATKLQCSKHFICNQKCLANRFCGSGSKEDMLKCSKCYDFTEDPGIYIFIDNSNIWIEAKALQSKLKRFKTKEDPRVRIDMGNLIDVLADKRKVSESFLYGSEPPAADTVWQKMKDKGLNVKIEKRSKISGKEKKVDTRLVTKVTALAIRTPIEERTTIVIVSGDADMIPAMEQVVEESSWCVEVCMWKQAMSHDVFSFEKDNRERVKVKLLDDFFDKVSFTNRFINSPKYHDPVNSGSVVFSIEDKAFEKGGKFSRDIPSNSWLDQLDSIAQLPLQCYWFDSPNQGGKTHDLVLFMRKPDSEAVNFDVERFIAKVELTDGKGEAKKRYRLPNITKVQTFLSYQTQHFKKLVDVEQVDVDHALQQVDIFNGDEAVAGSDNETTRARDPATDEWKIVQRRRRKHHSKQQYSEQCPLKYNCEKGNNCLFKHTKGEKTYFKGRKEGKGNPFRKTQSCKDFDRTPHRCTKRKNECEYAHGEEDAWCRKCHSSGHFTDNCPDSKPHAAK